MAQATLLLDAWREVTRHVDFSESLNGLANVIAAHVPADSIVVRRIDLPRKTLETAAVGRCSASAGSIARTPTECSAATMRNLLTWSRGHQVIGGVVPGPNEILSTAAPPGFRGTCLVAPIHHDATPVGIVLLVSADRQFSDGDRRLLADLAEPIGVALANTARVHELQRLREALEADKRTLLTKLGRHDVGDAIVGADAGLRTVVNQIKQVAPTEVPVLIIGETGSGKEVLARSLHDGSPRHESPFVRVNCNTIPAKEIETELFGHERDGHKGPRLGWFERADGGTLFLDEVAELPLDAQARLATFLQDGTIERVGSVVPLVIDTRIVAASYRDLREMVSTGTFREDLWVQLNVFPIQLPPLRERREDIPRLAAHFAARAGMRLAGTPLTPAAADVEALLAYHWPGNVRELAAVIERATILGRGRELKIEAALGGVGGRVATGAAPAPHPIPAPVLTFDEAMRRQIVSALKRTRGRIDGRHGAARQLQLNPHTLRGRMRRLRIDWRTFRHVDPVDAAAAAEPAAALDSTMKAHIEAALRAASGRIDGPHGAAKALAINPHTLRSRMRKFGIKARTFRPPS